MGDRRSNPPEETPWEGQTPPRDPREQQPPRPWGGLPTKHNSSRPKFVPKLGKARLSFQASRAASGTVMPKLRITPVTWSTSSAPHVVGVPESSSWALRSNFYLRDMQVLIFTYTQLIGVYRKHYFHLRSFNIGPRGRAHFYSFGDVYESHIHRARAHPNEQIAERLR